MPRSLYLAAYDIRSNKMRRRVYKYLSLYRVGGQKSVPEIWVTPSELRMIHEDLQRMVDADTDRLQLVALDPGRELYCGFFQCGVSRARDG